MIEVHVVNALLLPALREGTVFKGVNFINGLVAPSFLFCAGFAFAVTLERRWDEYLSLGRPFWRYLARLAFLLAIGYALHLPHFSLTRLLGEGDPRAWTAFFQSDILHVIALTLGFLLLSAVIIRDRPLLRAFWTVSALACVYAAPVVCALDYSAFPVWLRPFLSKQFMSQFPLFPWSAFLILGGLIGGRYIARRKESRESLFMLRLTVVAFGLTVGAIVAELLPVTVYRGLDFWGPSPQFFIVRTGIVGLAMALLWRMDTSSAEGRAARGLVRSPVTLFGRESLLVYVVHLLIVYGYMFQWSFVREFSQTLSFTGCLGLFAALSAAMYVLALFWHTLKTSRPVLARRIQYAVMGAIVLTFLLKAQ